MLGMTTTSDPGTSGIRDISVALGGGIRENSLVLIEGEARTGKSVLSQHIVAGVLHSRGSLVTYYSTEYNTESMLVQMSSMSLDIGEDLINDRFRVYRMSTNNVLRNAEKTLRLVTDHIIELPDRFKLVVVDSISPFITRVSPTAKIDFLQSCKELCVANRSIILVLDMHVFERRTLSRAFAMSDYYLRLKSQDMILETGYVDTRNIKVLEVPKLLGAERYPEGIRFEIKTRVGIQILPFVQIKV